MKKIIASCFEKGAIDNREQKQLLLLAIVIATVAWVFVLFFSYFLTEVIIGYLIDWPKTIYGIDGFVLFWYALFSFIYSFFPRLMTEALRIIGLSNWRRYF